jgi:hypothetical protein
MISKLFNSNSTQSFLFLLVFSFLPLLPVALAQNVALEYHFTYLGWSFQFVGFGILIVSYVLLVITAWLFNQQLTHTFEIMRRNAHTAWFFVILISTTWIFSGKITGFIEFWIFIFMLSQIFRLGKASKNYPELFNIAWGVALLSGVDAVYLWLLLPTLAMQLAYGKAGWRIFALPLLAFLMHGLMLYTIFIWLEQLPQLGAHYQEAWSWHIPDFAIINWAGIWWPLVLLLFFLGTLPDFFSTLQRANIYKRQAFTAMMGFFLGVVLFLLLDTREAHQWLLLGIFPLTIFLANSRQYARKTWQQILTTWTPAFILLIYTFLKY